MILTIPIWNVHFDILLYDEETADHFEIPDDVAAYTVYDSDLVEDFCLAACIFKDTKSDTIVHESLHLVREIMSHVGIELTDSSEEAYAYTLEYVYKNVKKVIKKLKEERKSNKKKKRK